MDGWVGRWSEQEDIVGELSRICAEEVGQEVISSVVAGVGVDIVGYI